MPLNNTEYTVLRTLLETGSPFLRDLPEPLEGEAVLQGKGSTSLPADVVWGSFVTHSNEPQRTSAGRLRQYLPPGITQTLSISPALEIKPAAFCSLSSDLNVPVSDLLRVVDINLRIFIAMIIVVLLESYIELF